MLKVEGGVLNFSECCVSLSTFQPVMQDAVISWDMA